ncbi:MAG: MarR family transcriptional regulator [Phycisphaerales bacterium]|nr:MarR family transcriptional regulator [Phycisphaerales bacterium]
MTQPTRVRPAALHAWEALLRAHARATAEIDRELGEQGLLQLETYDVLLELFRAPGRRLRHRDLARAVALSRSGLTRNVQRLAKAGLVRIEPCPEDARGKTAALTDKGEAAFRKTWPAYARGIARHFGAHLNDDEACTLAGLLSRVAPTERPM